MIDLLETCGALAAPCPPAKTSRPSHSANRQSRFSSWQRPITLAQRRIPGRKRRIPGWKRRITLWKRRITLWKWSIILWKWSISRGQCRIENGKNGLGAGKNIEKRGFCRFNERRWSKNDRSWRVGIGNPLPGANGVGMSAKTGARLSQPQRVDNPAGSRKISGQAVWWGCCG